MAGNYAAELAKQKGQGKVVDQSGTPVQKNNNQIYVPGEGAQSMDDYINNMLENTNQNNVLKLDTAEKEGNREAAKEAVKAGLQANRENNSEPTDYLKEKAEEYGVSLDEGKGRPSTSSSQKTGSDLGGRTTEEWYLYMLQQGYSPDEIADLYEKEGYSRKGAKFIAAADKYKNWGKDSATKEEVQAIVAEAGGGEEAQKNAWEKFKDKLKNKDLEAYAKENGISYGQALRYTLSSMLKGLANSYQPFTGVKPFSDEETLSPLEKRYRVTSGKVDEEAAKTKAGNKVVKDYDDRKNASLVEGDLEGKKTAQEDISSKLWTTENGQTYLDFAKLNADIKDIEDEQKLKTLQKELGLQNMAQKDLQQFLSALAVSQNYSMGKNAIKLEQEQVTQLGKYFAEHPGEIGDFKNYMQQRAEGSLTNAQEWGQWVNLVTDPVAKVAGAVAQGAAAGVTNSDRKIKNYLRVSGGK